MKDHKKKNEHIARCEVHDNSANINDKLIIHLRDLSHTMRSLYEGKGSQKRILIILDELGGKATQRELTKRLGIQPGSVSEVLTKLESANYIKRTPNKTDRRTIDVALTEEGKTLAAKTREQRIHRHEQMFSCLLEDEKNLLLSLLEKINADWEEHYQDMANK
ncbi:MAG: MarR family transcriptional regulator [Lachnospiraceae bacterium]|nr:MarR family transcriptional regulator [Lachnospiraceae bacterium]